MMTCASTLIPLSCANCMSNSETSLDQHIISPRDGESYVWDYKLQGTELTTLSTFQALALLFKAQTGPKCSVASNEDVCLCSPCGKLLGKILELRQEFLSVSLPNSFVNRLFAEQRSNESENSTSPPLNAVSPVVFSNPMETNGIRPAAIKIQISKISRQHISSQRARPVPPPSPPPRMSGRQMHLPLSHTLVQVRPGSAQPKPRLRPTILKSPREPKVLIQKLPTRPKTSIHTSTMQGSSPLLAKRSRTEKVCDLEFQEYPEICHLDDTVSSKLNLPMDLEGDSSFELDEDNELAKPNSSDLSTNVSMSSETNLRTAVEESSKEKQQIPTCIFVRKSARQAQCHTRYSEEDRKLLEVTSYKCYECSDSSQRFETFRDWVLHHLEVHERDLGYGSAEQLQIRPHLAPRHERLRPCPECGKMKQSDSQMLKHIKISHLKQFSQSCTICQKTFCSKQSLETHMKSFHSGKEGMRPHLCTLCGGCFRTRGSLQAHEKTHLGLVNFKYSCDICHSKFITKGRFNDHKTTHSDERPHACESCPMTFKTRGHLKAHTDYNHVQDKTPTVFCEFCQKGFRRNVQLKGHLMCVHKLSTEEANKSANIKSFVFRVQENGEHVYYEKARKPKTCEYCQKTYVRREGLFLHLISVHGKTEEESKEMTGLESKRDLFPSRRGGGGPHRKNVRRADESD